MSRRDSVLRRPDRPAAPLVLLLTLTLLQGAAAGRLEERDVILIGYTEQKRRAAAEAAVKQQLGGVAGGVASGTVGVALDPLCPPDDRPDHCPGWARIGECLRNPVFMRKSCKASCKVLPSCFASIASGPWGGHATPAGTARFALGADEAAAGHFREHAVRYTGAAVQAQRRRARPHAAAPVARAPAGTSDLARWSIWLAMRPWCIGAHVYRSACMPSCC